MDWFEVSDIVSWLLKRPLHARILLAAYYYEQVMGKPAYTRQLLRLVGNGSEATRKVSALNNLVDVGLIKRYKDYEKIGKRKIPVIRNKVTDLGKRIAEIIAGIMGVEEQSFTVLGKNKLLASVG